MHFSLMVLHSKYKRCVNKYLQAHTNENKIELQPHINYKKIELQPHINDKELK